MLIDSNKHYCYLLENPIGLTYLGATSNLKRRLRQHNSTGNKRGYTINKGPWRIIALEEFNTRKDAFDKETFLKKNYLHKKSWAVLNKTD